MQAKVFRKQSKWRKLGLVLVVLMFLVVSLSQRAVAAKCSRRWDCGDKECCHAGECLSKRDPRCKGGTPTFPPTISASLICSLWGNAGWCTGVETLDLNATEPQGNTVLISGDISGNPFACPSGAGSASCSVPLPEGSGVANFTATSTTGKSASGSTSYYLDTVQPQINGTLTGTAGSNGWYISPVDVSASASDPSPGSGIATFNYNLNGGGWSNFSGTLNLTDGVHSLSLQA